MQNKPRQSYAPFGSVSKKKQKKNKKQGSSPGPGSYDVGLPLINPIVQTIKKRNNNIIVKLGHIGTAAFLDHANRFSQDSRSNLGPGQQNLQQQIHRSKSPKQQRKYAALRLKQIIRDPMQRHPTITEVKKIQFDDEIQMPDKKEVQNSRLKESKDVRGYAWSRMTQERDHPGKKSNLGPGSYNLPAHQNQKILKKHPSSAFVSGSVRSFFDQIRFQTNHDTKARQREVRNYKSDGVGPGSYEVSPSRKHSVYKYQFFGSTQQRL